MIVQIKTVGYWSFVTHKKYKTKAARKAAETRAANKKLEASVKDLAEKMMR